jgi:hypothetical protein
MAPDVAVLSLAEEVLEPGPEDESKGDDGDGVTRSLLLLGKGVELREETDELAVGDVELDPDGGGTIAPASTSLPIPQGIASPDGCLGLAGGVEEPSGPSMVNRVVQVLVVV